MKKQENVAQKLRAKIELLLSKHIQTALTVKQMLGALGMQMQDRAILQNELNRMQAEGLLIEAQKGRYGLPDRLDCLTGVVQGNRRGFAFVRPDRQSEDVFISASNLRDAAHGDRVIIRLDSARSQRRRAGTVVGILKRGQSRLVGTLSRDGKKYQVIPDDTRFPGAIQIPSREIKEARPGDKVVVEIHSWSKGHKPSQGHVVEYIGPAGTPRTESITFKYKFELPGDHPPLVIKELETLPGEEAIESMGLEQGRQDLRSLTMVTIDDESARDFDDAVSLELLPEGSFRLGVHIADVSQYVQEGKPLDREALKRGTSIYLADRVIHMLPPLLSEKICSLQAKKDRLAVSVFMDLNAGGELIDYSFCSSLIMVTERLTYQQVETYLRGGRDPNLFQESSLAGMLDNMEKLAAVLRTRRLSRGALDLDLPEARIVVDETGNPLSVERRNMGLSESLIEEFMIFCNETVAAHLITKKLPCIYRVHAVPTEEKLAILRETLTLMGVAAVSRIKQLKPKHLKELLEQTKGEPAERLVRYLVLRSLPQARYSAANEGHFGLASRGYLHFTSPIRRYPDLVVHRILKQHLSPRGLAGDRVSRLQARLPAVAQQASERERAAVEAERASVEIKKAQYMEKKLGEIYPGIINGVTNFGIFVELANTVEGMIPISELGNDHYVYNEKAAALVGERTRKTYRLGDSIQIVVVRSSRSEGKVTFAPA
ncbi:MAG TPA: ribonuclease R [Candidatus Limnocylindrales bacterium]|nr:ribonuclease R [Candidatus Limnocylindrales bacterium]